MNADTFLDTNILVYATAKGDNRSAVAIDLLAAGGVVSVQVFSEFVSVARRKLKWTWPDVISKLSDFRALVGTPRPLSANTHEAALEIAQCDGLSIYDALIVASAIEAGCRTLLSEDMQHGRVFAGQLTIRNPFAATPA